MNIVLGLQITIHIPHEKKFSESSLPNKVPRCENRFGEEFGGQNLLILYGVLPEFEITRIEDGKLCFLIIIMIMTMMIY